MKHFLLIFLLIFASYNIGKAQINIDPVFGIDTEISVGFLPNNTTTSLAIQRSERIFSLWNDNFQFNLGYGLRFTGYFVGEEEFEAIPRDLKADILRTDNSNLFFFNALIIIEGRFFDRLDAGFNIDVVGVGFGSRNNFNYVNNGNFISVQEARPTTFNLLRGGVSDLGSLNSEFYLRYWLNERWAVKVAQSHVFTEYTTTNAINGNNNFRMIRDLFVIGVTYRY